MTKTVAVIGGGPAGMQASSLLAAKGYLTYLIEEQPVAGGHLNLWDRLFPNKRSSSEVLEYLQGQLPAGINILQPARIDRIINEGGRFRLLTEAGREVTSDALVIATGFEVFDAHRKEEYGYGIYDNVITSVDLEQVFRSGKPLLTQQGQVPATVGIVHCVGSRDEKVGQVHCSRVCCVTGVKQAVELKEMNPQLQVFCFYMDLRMFGLGYEELYKESQEKWHVRFIRGRLSEAFENQDGTILVKIEDTLTGKPLRMNLDLLVLLVGFLPSEGTVRLAGMLGLDLNPNGFLKPRDEHTLIHDTCRPGVFLTGSCKGPMNVGETLADARSVVTRVEQYFQSDTHD